MLTMSIKGYLPAIQRHWYFNSLARELFSETGFPMWGCGKRLFIPRELQGIYLSYFNFLDHEPLTRRVIAGALKPGAVMIDVGANLGYYTLLAAERVGSKGNVYSVECSPDTLALLRENVRRNHLENVTVMPVAAAKKRGELVLNVSAIGLSWFELHSNWPKVEGATPTVTVPAVPLDEMITTRVDVAKIDAEGADLEVLQGMVGILTQNKDIALIVEWAPKMLADAGKDPFELPRWLEQKGFTRITVLNEQTNKPMSLSVVTELYNTGQVSATWVGDLFARR